MNQKAHETEQNALTITETNTGWTRTLHFRDRGAPHDVQFALERILMSLFTLAPMDDGTWCVWATPTVVGSPYRIELRLDAALENENAYSLRVGTSWAGQSAANFDYYRKSSIGWFDVWTRELTPSNPPHANAGSPSRYRELAAAALHAATSLNTIEAIQHVIVEAMKHGASFATSDKEGTTNIFWRDGCFRRSDDGDNPGYKVFADEADFLKALRRFFDMTITRTVGTRTLSPVDAWKLILRLLRT